MKPCLTFDEVLEVGHSQVTEMQKIGNSYASPDLPGACDAFTRQVRLVQGSVVQTYGIAASLARKAQDLAEVAEIWNGMSSFCKTALEALNSLKDKYPDCGTPELCDLILDYKLASDKRYKGVIEEIECQKLDFPKGLLPELK